MTDTEIKAALDEYAKEKRELERENAELKRLLSRIVEMVPHESLTLFGDQMALGQAKRAVGL